MKIGEIAQQTGLTAKTIRYYESLGLVHSLRLENGYRDYGPFQQRQLQLLAHARQVGFSLEECRNLLALLQDDQRHSKDVKASVLEKIASLDAQMEQLQQMRAILQSLAQRCAGDEDSECAILQTLSRPSQSMPFTLLE